MTLLLLHGLLFVLVFLLMKEEPWNLLLSTSMKHMGLSFSILNGLVCKSGINRGQIICLWRFAYSLPCSHTHTWWLIYGWECWSCLKFQVCKIVEGQRYSKRLNERQITALLKVTCQRPHERELDIMQVCCCYEVKVFSMVACDSLV